jgi:hypothetical protein
MALLHHLGMPDFETPFGDEGKIHAIYEFKRDGTLRLAFIDKNAPEAFETKGNHKGVTGPPLQRKEHSNEELRQVAW